MTLGRCEQCRRPWRSAEAKALAERRIAIHLQLRAEVAADKSPDKRARHVQTSEQFRQTANLNH